MVPTLNEEQLKRAEKALGKLGTQQPEQDKPEFPEPRIASSFGKSDIRFLWYPYLPIGDYSVVMGDGGTGKTVLICGIAANISTGTPLPGQSGQAKPQNVLIISAEDSGEVLSDRLKNSGADLNHIYILDRTESIGLSIADDYDKFERAVMWGKPSLVVIDPWQAFLGASVDINRVNALRPVLQRISGLAKKCNCAMVLLSHVNKRAQGENANNAATGSTDFVNAARSAMRVIFDPRDDDSRVLVHTKSNHARAGESVRYRITDGGGLEWCGFAEEIDRKLLEETARKRKSLAEVLGISDSDRAGTTDALVHALETSADFYAPTRAKFGYDDFKSIHGADIFGGRQAKRALDSVVQRLAADGYCLETGKQVFIDGRKQNGFYISLHQQES